MKKLKSNKINLLIVFCIITMFIFMSYNRYVLATIDNDEEISFVLEEFFTNKNNLLKSIQGFEDQLDILKKAIKEEDADTLKAMFIESSKRRRNLEK